MKSTIPALSLITLASGISTLSAQTSFPDGISVGNPVDAYLSSFDMGAQSGTQLYTPGGGIILYSDRSETARGNFDGGVSLYGKPITMVLGADSDPSNGGTGTFDVWKGSSFWDTSNPLSKPVFSVNTFANTANFDSLNVSITNGTLSIAGDPVLTSASASAIYLTPAQANTSYPLKTALPNYGVDGTNFDRANGSATFGNNSYALGINNFSTGTSRVGRDNGLSWPGSGTSSNATTPIPFNNFKNNAAFGSSKMGNPFSSWGANSFKGTEKLENNLTTGTSRLAVSAGAQILNSTALGNSSLSIEPMSNATSPNTGVSLTGNAYAAAYGNARLSNTTITGSSSVNLWHETSPTNGTNTASADNSVALGGSTIGMTNQYTTASPDSNYVTVAGNSKSLAVSARSVTFSTALGKSMVYTGDYSFGNTQGYGPGAYFPGTDRWVNIFPRMATTHAFAAGESVVANGTHGTALGKARVYADFGTAIGEGVDAGTAGTTVLGRYNKLQQFTYSAAEEGAMQQFVVGNGTGDADANRSNAVVVERTGLTTLTNKSWKANVTANPSEILVDPPSTTNDRGGDALLVEGHTRLKGKILIEAQGDLSMSGFEGGERP